MRDLVEQELHPMHNLNSPYTFHQSSMDFMAQLLDPALLLPLRWVLKIKEQQIPGFGGDQQRR